jgi:DNA-binding winged helix-turn-helix (wHTH) protein
VREGHQLLDDVAREAASAGAELIVRQIDRARRADPRRGVLDDRARPSRPGEIRRDRVLAVLRALAAGELAVGRGYLASLIHEATLDPLERALIEVARAALAREAGEASADDMVTHAAELAGRAGADPELIVDLDRWLRGARTPGRAVQPIVVDRRDHEIRIGGEVVTLSSRPTLRRLLYALLAEPGRSVGKASLARALWPSKYRPERHDNALWVCLKRLRDLLHGTGLRVVTEPTGYSVVIEDGYQLVVAHQHA